MTRNRKILIIVGVIIAAYFAYRWYQNRQSTAIQGNAGSSLGTNLNSAAPALTDAASGDNSAPQYTSGNESITIDLPNGDQSVGGNSSSGDTDNPPAGGGGPNPRPVPQPIPKPKPKPVPRPVKRPVPVNRRPRPIRG